MPGYQRVLEIEIEEESEVELLAPAERVQTPWSPQCSRFRIANVSGLAHEHGIGFRS